MTFKAYLDNIKTQTGKTPQDFLILAEKKGLLKENVKTGEIVAWLKNDFGLGQGHAMAIVLTFRNATQPRQGKNEKINALFDGGKRKWQVTYQALLAKVKEFGPGVSEAPTDTYISLLRQGRKFAIVQFTAQRMDIGIKLKGTPATERFETAGAWNAMVTHRVRIKQAGQVDSEVLDWLKKAYDKALQVQPATSRVRSKSPARQQAR
jgi:hypothetical protein